MTNPQQGEGKADAPPQWVALWDQRDEEGNWSNGGPCITTDPEMRAIAGYHAGECYDCNERIAAHLNALTEQAAKAEADLAAAQKRIEELEAKMEQLLAGLVDDGDCWFDHHGGCQAHGYLELHDGQICPHQEAKDWLAARAEAAEKRVEALTSDADQGAP